MCSGTPFNTPVLRIKMKNAMQIMVNHLDQLALGLVKNHTNRARRNNNQSCGHNCINKGGIAAAGGLPWCINAAMGGWFWA